MSDQGREAKYWIQYADMELLVYKPESQEEGL